MAKRQDAVRLFKVLSSGARVRILELLKGGALCVGALSARLGITPGAVSQHLRVLRDTGLVAAEKRGYYVHYALNASGLRRLTRAVEELTSPTTQTGARRCVRRRKAARSRRT